MSERPGPPPDNIIRFDPNEALKRRLEKIGELDDVLAASGEEMRMYERRRAEGKETRGKWTVSVVDTANENAIRHLVVQNERGDFVLMPNDAEHLSQEHIFATDQQAEMTVVALQQRHPEITGSLEFRAMCGGIDEDQDDAPPIRLVPPAEEQ